MQAERKAGWRLQILIALVGLIILVPFAWMVATGLMTTGQTLMVPPNLIPSPPTFDGISEVFNRVPFATLLVNTIAVSFGRAMGTLVICAMAAYALAIIKVPGTSAILVGILVLIMVPGDIFIVPNFAIIASFRMTDTLVALFLPSLFDVFGVFLLYQFFRGVPRELIEAARLDGASHLRILVTIVVPVARSGILSLAILSVLSEWKDLLWPLVVNRSIDKLTLGPGLALLRGVYTTDWNVVMAAGAMAALPMVAIFLILQKQFITSFARSGLK
ncbi:sugar ABC transporter permease [Kaistia sp. 32K]|uniref:carbohydrate ABC transporter permease n=1 Tax=Kaistia sp. 32K TaxID=2795690 RepID=UPI001915D337|nr:carbohydrate ABC transporter permease [Kaistia sp. 32K]BCP55556.1 sugar ABC transporter permease [Kaistia sp. 32K]